jgi:hypothetical protein
MVDGYYSQGRCGKGQEGCEEGKEVNGIECLASSTYVGLIVPEAGDDILSLV